MTFSPSPATGPLPVSRWRAFWRWVLRPSVRIQDLAAQRQAQLLAALLLFLLALTFFGGLWSVASLPNTWLPMVGAWLGFVAAFALNRRGQVQVAGLVTVVVLSGLLYGLLLAGGKYDALILESFLIWIILPLWIASLLFTAPVTIGLLIAHGVALGVLGLVIPGIDWPTLLFLMFFVAAAAGLGLVANRHHRNLETDRLAQLGLSYRNLQLELAERKRVEDALQSTNRELRQAYDTTIEGWSAALDLRDKETEGHSQRVTALTLKLAQAAGMSAEALTDVRRGALLHDIGKMGVPDAILLKPGPLTDAEWAVMRQHPSYAYDLLAPVAFLRPALDIPQCHHEKWDGTGYPRQLRGEEIPLAARLFAVADVWDALSADRPYRSAWPKARVLAHIQALAGSHFDPEAVRIFLETIE